MTLLADGEGLPKNTRLTTKIARRLAGNEWPETPEPQKTSGSGATADVLDYLQYSFYRSLSTKRRDVYADVTEMDETVEEVSTALDMIADNAMSSEVGLDEAFRVTFPSGEHVSRNVRKLIERMLEETRWQEKASPIVREALLMGDGFYQYVIDSSFNVVRLMYMPPESMVRNEDTQGLLMPGKTQGEWAFEQYRPGTNQFLTGFYPWQMEHLRWGRTGRSPYGRSMLFTARTAWRKLQAMEEALVINWLTRAFARLLFILDVTGKSEKEARQAINDFKGSLQTRKVAHDVKGVEHLSIVRDIYMGRSYHEMGGKGVEGLTDAKVLDTSSSAFTQLSPIAYYQRKILMAMRTPPAYLGIEEQVNAKATLTQEDRRYARLLRATQSFLGRSIRHCINLQLALKSIDPRTVPFTIEWPSASWLDVLDDSSAQANYATADSQYLALGIVDKEYIATHHLHMTQSEFEAVQERLKKQAEEQAAMPQPTVPTGPTAATGPTGPTGDRGGQDAIQQRNSPTKVKG